MYTTLIGPLALFAAGAVPPEGDNQARQLVQRMERKIAATRSLDAAFAIKVEQWERGGPAQTREYDGSLAVAEGNRARLEIWERSDGRVPFHFLASDGRRWWWHDKGSPPHLVQKPPDAKLADEMRTSLARAGVYLPTRPLPPVEAADARERFPVSGFRYGPSERVDGRDARRVEYDLFVKGQVQPDGSPMPFRVQLWLDLATSLPVRRVVTQTLRGGDDQVLGRMAITESYPKLLVDRAADVKTFELPPATTDTIVER